MNAHNFSSIRKKHQVGRHLLAFADGGADWCRRCGDFSHNLQYSDGQSTECNKTPKAKRWWPQRNKKRMMNAWVAIAYRWGWLNNHSYIVRVVSDLQSAIDAAKAEADDRGGKYGVTVWSSEGKMVHHSPSAYGEEKAFTNYRMEMFEAVGLRVVAAMEDGRPMTTDEIRQCWESEKKTQEMMERITKQTK